MALIFALIFYPKPSEAEISQHFLTSNNFLFAETLPIKENEPLAQANIINNSFLEPIAPAFLIESKTMASLTNFSQKQEPFQYLVESGDTLAGLAEKFSISVETLLWANNLTSSSKLKIGQELLILPVSGVLHLVKKGETLSQIAKTYQVDSSEITIFNGLSQEGVIFAGDFLIVPGGKKPKASPSYTKVPVPQTYFIVPMPSPVQISQGLHWFNAVDFNNNRCGDPVFA
ncbi:LysM peptidoglycan-binding domain-containing protein, partial [Candidatus Gribaldobacteria bacterium]|nr:LysM peptidoglycan-binding domain-containing protein [Candidatus Gribaldobacteria bacterium]